VIAVDTNVAIRYLTLDGEGDQVQKAIDFFNGLSADCPGYFTLVVVAEIWWVLRRSYKYSSNDCCDALQGFLESVDLRFEDAELVQQAISLARDGSDLADCLISLKATQAGCVKTVTLDDRAARKSMMYLL